MSTYFEDPDSCSWVLPEQFADDDVRLSEEVIERYIGQYTSEGETVFDPFAGFGTTLVVAERMGRKGMGYELLHARATYINAMLNESEVKCGDVLSGDLSDVTASLVLFSPPYMNRTDTENPLAAYEAPVESYERYIEELAAVCVKVASVRWSDDCAAPELEECSRMYIAGLRPACCNR